MKNIGLVSALALLLTACSNDSAPESSPAESMDTAPAEAAAALQAVTVETAKAKLTTCHIYSTANRLVSCRAACGSGGAAESCLNE